MENKIDIRVLKTYKLLHLAFTGLLEKKSFEELTVSELCDKAMIRKNTFYSHFSDKYEYFNFYLSELRKEFQENASKRMDTKNPADYSLQMLHEMFQFLQTNRLVLKKMENSNRALFLYQSLEEQVSLELSHILLEMNPQIPSIDLSLLISFYSGGIINVMRWWINHPTELTEDIIAEKLIQLIPLSTNFSTDI